ncbi:terminase family protein, partial [Candidatus Pacearchaeota archaeon]|nr:terminase family protein [Candidatus Pacearchaeota archaeon]
MSLTSTMSLLADLLDPPEIERDVQPFPKWLPRNFPSPDWVWNKKHLVLIQKELMAMHAGDYSHLLILLPPRHGKSEQVTVRWPAWNLELDPKKKIIVGAYNKDFASTFSGEIRRLVSNIPSIRISKENKRRADWKTADGGGVVAAGVGSAPTGRGGDILIIDDPVKNRKEANSITYRNDVWNWFLEDMYTRREPGAQTIVIMTQWHDDDLAGRLMTRGAWRGVFKVLRIPALAETQEERDLYHGRFESLEVGVPDPVGRKPGAPLWKERFNKKMLEKIRLRLGRAFSALYQQRPQPVEGGQFKRSWFSKIIPNVPLDIKCTFVRYWDKAGTEDGGKYTAGVLIMHLSGL